MSNQLQSLPIFSHHSSGKIFQCLCFILTSFSWTHCRNQVRIYIVGIEMLQLNSEVNCMTLQGHNFHFNFPSTSADKVWMWHEMRYGSRANWYLINARPDWRAQAHLLHVSSNMHDLQAGFLPQQTFHAIRSINVKWCRPPAHRGSKYSGATLCKSWQMLCGLCQRAEYFMHKIQTYHQISEST